MIVADTSISRVVWKRRYRQFIVVFVGTILFVQYSLSNRDSAFALWLLRIFSSKNRFYKNLLTKQSFNLSVCGSLIKALEKIEKGVTHSHRLNNCIRANKHSKLREEINETRRAVKNTIFGKYRFVLFSLFAKYTVITVQTVKTFKTIKTV
jgi:hypothetical protein